MSREVCEHLVPTDSSCPECDKKANVTASSLGFLVRENDDLRQQLTEAQERENYLVEILSKAARWSEGSQTYAHAIGHIENVISNLRCDLKVEKAENERLKSLYDDLLYCVESKVPGQTRHETAKATLQAAGWDGSEVPKQALKG